MQIGKARTGQPAQAMEPKKKKSVDDLTVAVRIQPLSKGSEWIAQILWLLLVFFSRIRDDEAAEEDVASHFRRADAAK